MKISIIQTDICWEDKSANLQLIHHRLQQLAGQTDLVILPEMFSTGFSMRAEALAEPTYGPTLSQLKQWAARYGLAIAGSYLSVTPSTSLYYNRAFFLTPHGEQFFYDKRHLFTMGGEHESFTPGLRRLILPYKGWNICLLVCYDLRFPIWSRNTGCAYDLLIYVANWPAARRHAWDTLLTARAIENQAYVAGVNRIGTDGNLLPYNGGSTVISPKGEVMGSLPDSTPGILTTELSLDSLRQFRRKFPAWKDADRFEICL